MLSLNDLRSPAAALDWHEAVAAGAALGSLLAAAQAPACPRPSDVGLLPSGDLRVTGPGHLEGSAAAGVAHVVGQLLEASPCPAELRQLIEAYATDRHGGPEGAAALATLVSELAFFERPGRREVLAAVALRAEPAIERARRAAALAALTERTRLADGEEPPGVVIVPAAAELDSAAVANDSDAPRSGGAAGLIIAAVVALTAFLAVAYGTAAWLDRPPATTAAADAGDDDPPATPGSRPADAAPPSGTKRPRPSAAPPRERPPAVAQPAPSVGPTAPAAPPASATPTGATPTSATPPPSPRTVDVVVAERDGRVVPSRVAPQRPAPRVTPSGEVFEPGDPQVTPAILIRPHLPDSPPPDVPEEQIGTLEFVVAQSGAVEHVHLVSPANRYQERMLVAAAKTWQFRPATRDGRPVRFRTRIRVTL